MSGTRLVPRPPVLVRPLGQGKPLANKGLRGFVPLSHALGTGQVRQDRMRRSWDRWDKRDKKPLGAGAPAWNFGRAGATYLGHNGRARP